MIVVGAWFECDDGITRPVLEAHVMAADGTFVCENFLIDTGADCTVLSGTLLTKLAQPRRAMADVSGVGGRAPVVEIETVLRIPASDGRSLRIQGPFTAFVDPRATDLSILGRDVIDELDLIVSRRRAEVVLLYRDHAYRIEPDHPGLSAPST